MPLIHRSTSQRLSSCLRRWAWQLCVSAGVGVAASLTATPTLAWEPSAPVELVVPAGAGGGADQMARFIAQLAASKQLLRQPINVVNKSGNSGMDALLDIQASKGNPHKLVITLSNLFTAPLATGVQFSWRDITPVQMLALDQFVLWVSASSPHKTAKDLLDALRSAGPGRFTLGGTGSKQEDQLISVLLETAAATRITYVPLKGGGDVARALADGEVDISVNNPIEAEALWRQGKLRPLCVFDGQRLDGTAKVAGGQSWADLPTCMSVGIPTQYQMMRSIFTTPGATPDQVAFYSQLLDKLRATPEWQAFMVRGAFKQTSMAGPAFDDWLDKSNRFHNVLMREAKLKVGSASACQIDIDPDPRLDTAHRMFPGAITDIAGLSVGHYTDTRRPTGCTVLLCPQGAVAGVDVRGAAPGTRETDLLHPLATLGAGACPAADRRQRLRAGRRHRRDALAGGTRPWCAGGPGPGAHRAGGGAV